MKEITKTQLDLPDNTKEIETSNLDYNRKDKNVFLLKTFIKTAFPGGIGDGLAEIVGSLIPNQQMDRVIRCLRQVVELAENDHKKIEDWLKLIKQNNLLLFEQTVRYSSQTESDIKLHCYAFFIYNVVNTKSKDEIEEEAILRTISELNEYEILHLIGIESVETLFNESDFHRKFGKYIDAHSQCGTSNDSRFNSMMESYLNNLVVKGLAIAKNDLKKGDSSLYLSNYGKIVFQKIFDEQYFCK